MRLRVASIGPGLVALASLAAAAVALPPAAAGQCLQASLLPPASAGAAGGGWAFGFAVDVSGERLIVGAPGGESDPLARSGFGIYERSGASWQLVYDGFARYGDDDAGFDVAIDGDWAAVGVPRIGVTPAAPGEVIVLRRLPAGWRPVQTLAGEPGHGEQFGISVDLDGGLLAVGQRSASMGAAQVFRLAGGAWVLDQLVGTPAAAGDGFGRAVAVLDVPGGAARAAPGAASQRGPPGAPSGGPPWPALIVGAPGHDVFGGQDGAAHVFLRDPDSGWTAVAQLSSFLPGAQLGSAVALSPAFAAAGGPFADAGGAQDEGLLVISRWDGGHYSEPALIPGTASSLAGSSLAADELRVYFGCPGWGGLFDEQPAAGLLRGYAFLPEPPSFQLWPGSAAIGVTPVGQAGPGDAAGRSAAVDGTRLVFGAPGRDGVLPDTGAIFVYDLGVPAWSWDDFSIAGALGPSGGGAGLFATGSLCAGDGVALLLHHALPNTPVALVIGFSELDAPFLGGTLIPSPDAIVYLPTDAAGDVHADGAIPRNLPAGTDLWMHAWWPDPGGPAGFAASNALHGVTQ